MSDNLKEEEKHLKKVIQSNGCDISPIRAGFIKSYLLEITQILNKRKIL